MKSKDTALIQPHGGELVNRVMGQARRAELEGRLAGMLQVALPEQQQCDLEMIAICAFSPLSGFMGPEDFHAVCQRAELASGLPWGVPITCRVDQRVAERLQVDQEVCLTDEEARPLAVMQVRQKYRHEKLEEAEKVYLTKDPAHPGVAALWNGGEVCLGGPVEVLTPRHEPDFAQHRLWPAHTRQIFAERGWRSVAAFQTRNPIHRAHEYLTKCALEICDGLLIHPLVGQTQKGDIPAGVRMRCYEVLLANYYNPQNTLLSVFPAAMRYAGPREAIFHAMIRKNYGCTHLIVGRDHAGVGKYYGTYDAQRIFDEFDPAEIGITPLRFEHSFWCNKSGAMATAKTTNSSPDERVFLSGTAVREMLSRGERPPAEFTRPEIADMLIEAMRTTG